MKNNFDYSDYTLISKRTNSDNYLSKNGKYILKLPGENIDNAVESLTKEINDSKIIAKLGIPVPKLLDIVKTTDGRVGILGEYIKGKKSVSRAISEQPEKSDNFIRRYVDIGNSIHEISCDTGYFPSITEKIHEAAEKSYFLNNDERDYIHNTADSVPKTTTCLHGDFQFSNVILSDSGDYAIDLAFFCYGNPIFDWGLTNMMISYASEEIIANMFHMSKPYAITILRKCAKEYLNTKDDSAADEFIRRTYPYGIAVFTMHHQVLKTKDGEKFIKEVLGDLMRKPVV